MTFQPRSDPRAAPETFFPPVPPFVQAYLRIGGLVSMLYELPYVSYQNKSTNKTDLGLKFSWEMYAGDYNVTIPEPRDARDIKWLT